jgi:hypothetical protein
MANAPNVAAHMHANNSFFIVFSFRPLGAGENSAPVIGPVLLLTIKV